MKIIEIKMTPVTVPMEAPLRWSLGVETGTSRTIVEVVTDEGIVGLGETYGGAATVGALESVKHMIVGNDPFQFEKMLKKLQVFCISYETLVPPHVIASIDMACLDIMGKALKRPVCDLIGGRYRDEIAFLRISSYVISPARESVARTPPNDWSNIRKWSCRSAALAP
jgi:glucarate dehydratase